MATTTTDPKDIMYMQRCIQLARRGEGRTYPNPMVGAVVVCDDRIIGEGWHHKAGQGHAEVNAIASVKEADRPLLKRSTIYVSLEPCAHFGKTPPCADLIVRSQIPRVVVGCKDTFAKVSGRGIEILEKAGCQVTVGVLEEECRQLNRRFFTMHELKRPYVILKWAQSANGIMGGKDQSGEPTPVRISDAQCQMMVHKQRTTEQGIMVGIGTVKSDDPQLSARLWAGNSPTRFIVDPDLRMGKHHKVLTDGGRTVVINSEVNHENGNVKYVRADFDNDVSELLKVVGDEGVMSLIVEGGARTLQYFITDGLWDEAYVYVADHDLPDGVRAPSIGNMADQVTRVGNCMLRHYTNKK